jgi:hypothetical protein
MRRAFWATKPNFVSMSSRSRRGTIFAAVRVGNFAAGDADDRERDARGRVKKMCCIMSPAAQVDRAAIEVNQMRDLLAARCFSLAGSLPRSASGCIQVDICG